MRGTVEPKRIDREGNASWPLPVDYDTLTRDGQRQARVNAVAQWQLPGTLAEKALLYEGAIRFFDYYYLWPDPEADFNPLFYDDDPVPEAIFHRGMWRTWGTTRASLDVAPRGSAKSKNMVKSVFPRILTAPWSYVYATSTTENAETTGQWFKDQLLQNDRLVDDFSPCFPDRRITPRRGERPFGSTKLYLNNGAWVRMLSVESRQRGGRPLTYLLDDPEYDPKQSTSMEVLRAGMERLLFKLILPMLQRPGASVHWTATFISKRHYAFYAMETVDTPHGPRAKDTRFNSWHRTLIRSEWTDREGRRRSCWPEMWPLTRKDATEMAASLKQPERISLEAIREDIGIPNYNSEYLGTPGEGDGVFFPPLTEDEHGYALDASDGLPPYESSSQIRWRSSLKGEPAARPLRDFLRECSVFVCADTSWTANKDSDYKAATCMACTPENELFVLDCWGAQCQEHLFIREIFRMADWWHASTIYPEVVQQSVHFYEALDSIVKQRATDMAGSLHLPRIVPLKIPVTTIKTNRIGGLIRRFNHCLIKLPLHLKWERHWLHLFDQIAQFNPGAQDGGLQHDDFIDTVSMSDLVLKGRKGRPSPAAEAATNPLDRLLAGETHDQNGVPLLRYVDFATLQVSDVERILQIRRSSQRSVEPV